MLNNIGEWWLEGKCPIVTNRRCSPHSGYGVWRQSFIFYLPYLFSIWWVSRESIPAPNLGEPWSSNSHSRLEQSSQQSSSRCSWVVMGICWKICVLLTGDIIFMIFISRRSLILVVAKIKWHWGLILRYHSN